MDVVLVPDVGGSVRGRWAKGGERTWGLPTTGNGLDISRLSWVLGASTAGRWECSNQSIAKKKMDRPVKG
jgi:hypothetical protein